MQVETSWNTTTSTDGVDAAAATANEGGPNGATEDVTVATAGPPPQQLSSVELLRRLNEVCTQAAATTIPQVRPTVVRMMQPSVESRQFAELRATELAAGATLKRKKELHKKMGRLRRRDFRRWYTDCIRELDRSVEQYRWRDARKWKDMLRGVYRQTRVLPSRGRICVGYTLG